MYSHVRHMHMTPNKPATRAQVSVGAQSHHSLVQSLAVLWHIFIFTGLHLFTFQFYLCFSTPLGTLSIDPSITQSLLLNNERFMVPFSAVETNCHIFHSLEISAPLSSFTNHVFLPPSPILPLLENNK